MLQLLFLFRRSLCQERKIVPVVWRLWNTDTMRTETYFDDSRITKQEIFCNLQMLT